MAAWRWGRTIDTHTDAHAMTTQNHIGHEAYRGYLDLLLRRMADHLSEERILACALFGSVARGEARPDSDIDLLVVVSQVTTDTMPRFVRLLHALEDDPIVRELGARGLRPDPYPVFVTPRDLEERPLILLDILDHGIVLIDAGPLSERMERLRRRMAELGTRKVVHADGSWHWDLKPDLVPGEVIEL
ncbi:MAG: nucleotidyltransferase domain-containing protein [Candidatus Latescibacterota bacterium]